MAAGKASAARGTEPAPQLWRQSALKGVPWAVMLLVVYVLAVIGSYAYSQRQEVLLETLLQQRVKHVAREAEGIIRGLQVKALVEANFRVEAQRSLASDDLHPAVILDLGAPAHVIAGGRSTAALLEHANEIAKAHAASENSAAPDVFVWAHDKVPLVAACANVPGSPQQVACASMALQQLVDELSGAPESTFYRIEDLRGRVLARTQGASGVAPADTLAREQLRVDGAALQLVGGPSAPLRSEYAAGLPVYVAVLGSVLLAVALALVRFRERGLHRQRQLERAVAAVRAQGETTTHAALRLVAQGANVLVWMLAEDEQLELVGPWARQLGLSEGRTTLRETFTQSVHDRESVYTSLQDHLRRRLPWSRVISKDVDGDVITLQVRGSPLYGVGGEYLGMIGVTIDITEDLAIQGKVMRDEAYRAAQGNYMSYLAAQVREPAVNLQASMEIIARRLQAVGDEDIRRFANLASTQAAKLVENVQGALALLRLREQGDELKLEPMRIDGLTRDMARAIVTREAPGTPVIVDISTGGDAPALVHHASYVRVLNIVLTNALKFSPAQAPIKIVVSGDDSTVQVSITDAGTGVPRNELPRLGEPFFRGIASSGLRGQGLSLANALEHARASQAAITFANSMRPGEGLVVTITLPRELVSR